MKHYLPCLLLAAAALGLAACGGGGSPAAQSLQQVFGLSKKPALKGLSFPSDVAVAGDVKFSKAFPSLSFNSPLIFTPAPGDTQRVYVATQGGIIYVFDNRADVSTRKVFLDLSDRTTANGEQGLLGFTFDPDFASNGRFYVHYDANSGGTPGDTVVARYQIAAGNPEQGDRASEVKLFQTSQPYSNHNGGSIGFGPDKMLYIALGDGGSAGDPQNRAQNLGSPLGKILRIKTDGSIPADNPFVATAGARKEVWAYGLRNPFRVSFDSSTGQLWAGDVGQNLYEEIDVISRGGNYGWRLREGMHDYNSSDPRPSPPPLEPLFEYGHVNGQCSITGGVVYRGTAIPKLAGQYLYGDFCSGSIWALSQSGGTRVLANTLLGNVPNPSSFGTDASGEVYITGYDGNIYKLEPNTAGTGAPFPKKLSETGLFTDTARLVPNAGLTEYDINAPFWSDGARKRRWFGVPESSSIVFSSNGAYDFPSGSATVKHFEITNADGSTRRLETRVLLRNASGWNGYTYKWNAAGSDADLLDGSLTETITVRTDAGGTRTQDYEYPSRSACLNCHTNAAGVPLGLRTAQLNLNHDFSGFIDNQLRAYNHVALFDHDIGAAASYPVQTTPTDTSASLAARARSYLDVNCAQCHRPGGPTGVDMDLRTTTAIAATNTVGVAPTAGDLGIAGAQRVAAGDKARSLIWERMRRLDSYRMPPLASHVVDDDGLMLVGQWIDAGAS